jgi:flagellar motor switch protein FliM
LSTTSTEVETKPKSGRDASPRKPGEKPRSVYPCNFRSAGRLSNENARSLTAIHETFARHLASALDVQLGAGLEIKLQSLDQLSIKDHIVNIPALNYIVPFSHSTLPSAMIVECDIELVFPIIELLLGGTGGPVTEPRELSEIEEEIMLDVTTLIARQAENAWHVPAYSLIPGRRAKSSVLLQYCAPNEKVTVVKFDVDIAGTTGAFQLVFPTSFLNILIKQIKLDQPQKRGRLQYFPKPSIRERILDCDFTTAAELPNMKVALRDLVALQPGCVLKLRAPVRNPGMLTIGGQEIFEAVPVRNGSQKAAQLGRKTQSANMGRE